MIEETGFFYLNLANEWPTFARDKLEIAKPSGALTLQHLGKQFVERGVFRGGPFATASDHTPWYRLQVDADPLPDGTHVQFFTFTADEDDAFYNPEVDNPFGVPGWQAAPRDVLDILIPSPPARRLWLGGVVRSDGKASPILHQMRVDYGRDTYLPFLPAIYGADQRRRDFLERLLSLHASVLGGLEAAIDDLPRLFDPQAVPDRHFPSWLSWLADWLAFDLNEAWTEEETRQFLARAFRLYGQRGTVEGLRRYLKMYAGVESHIEEPGLQTHVWSLGTTSTLGFTTMLAPAHLQGAVLGTSATLGQSHVSEDHDFGAALFEDVAHHFCVQISCAGHTRPGVLEDARAVIEREKPAHTTYCLCVIKPRMRVGVQARIGIDAIIAQGPPAAHVGMVLDTGVLVAAAESCKIEEETADGNNGE